MENKKYHGQTFKDIDNIDTEHLRGFIYTVHKDYLSQFKGKSKFLRENTLKLFYYNILNLLYEILQSRNTITININTLDMIYETQDDKTAPFYFVHLNTSSGGEKYKYTILDRKYGTIKIQYKIFSEVLNDCLIKENICAYKRGYHDQHKRISGRYFINYKKIFNLLCRENIDDYIYFLKQLLDKREIKNLNNNVYVEIRQNVSSLNKKQRQEIKKENFIIYDENMLSEFKEDNKELIRESISFCRLQKEIYSKNFLSIEDFDSAPDEKRNDALQIYLEKNSNAFSSMSVEELTEEFRRKIQIKNLLLCWDRQNYKFRRIFHYFNDKNDFVYFGRYYASSLDMLEREYKELLLINDSRTVEYDLCSAISQISYILSGQDTLDIDFYNIEVLRDKHNLSRDDIKLGFMLLQNCKDTRHIYGSLWKRKKYELRELFKDGIFQSEVYNKFWLLKNFHMNPKEQLRIILYESKLISAVIEELYSMNIVSLYNFDALFVPDDVADSIVMETFKKVSMKLFNKQVYIKRK